MSGSNDTDLPGGSYVKSFADLSYEDIVAVIDGDEGSESLRQALDQIAIDPAEVDGDSTDTVAADRGAGGKNSLTRMRITLQEYDQAIALSQNYLNHVVEHHFDIIKPNLKKIDVQLQNQARAKLKGKIKAPRVELVDVDRGDQMLFLVEFESGKYSCRDYDNPKKNLEFDTEGWILAFYVDLHTSKLARLPDHIRAKINRPGSYAADQLLFNFNSGAQQLLWSRCKVTGFKTEKEAEHQISPFVNEWISEMARTKQLDDMRPVLAYAVRMDVAAMSEPDIIKVSTKSRPFAPPTAVSLQTIHHRPDGTNDTGTTTSHQYNAFIFAETTDKRELPRADLKWTGNWFYEDIPGTLLVKGEWLWDPIIFGILQKVQYFAINVCSRSLSTGCGTTYRGSKLVSNGPRQEWRKNKQGSKLSITGGVRDSTVTQWDGNSEYQDHFLSISRVDALVKPCVGESKLAIDIWSEVKTELTTILVIDPPGETRRYGSVVTMYAWFETWLSVYINLIRMEGTGQLTFSCSWKESETKNKVVTSNKSRTAYGQQYVDAVLAKQNFTSWETAYIASVKKVVETYMKIFNKLLNEIRRPMDFPFIYPASGGKFDLKDPVFTHTGDLMIGLTPVS